MKLVECPSCGSKELSEENGNIVCVYCRSKYSPQAESFSPTATVIEIATDIQSLLQKCREDPMNRRRFANLVLDIDPSNQEAKQYLL